MLLYNIGNFEKKFLYLRELINNKHKKKVTKKRELQFDYPMFCYFDEYKYTKND
jgi:hypothetical protein